MSSKKNKSKSKRGNEGDNSSGLKDGSGDSTNLQNSTVGANSNTGNNSFAVIDFIEKGKLLSSFNNTSRQLFKCIVAYYSLLAIKAKLGKFFDASYFSFYLTRF